MSMYCSADLSSRLSFSRIPRKGAKVKEARSLHKMQETF